jgi:tetratricopeptide (TPR) repeat protein
LAELHRRKGDHDQAMELSRAALLREPKTLSAYKVMMRSYLDRRQLAMAKLVALRALKLDDADPELYYTIGLILLAEKDAIQARLQFLRAVEVRPDYLPAHVELAKIAMQLEDYEGVEEHLRKILQADGKNAAAHLDLGVAYKGLGQYDKAMQEYEEAERLDPKLAATYLNRGIILHRFKDAPERAVDYYKKYLSLSSEGAASPDSPVVGLLKEAEQMVQLKKEAEAAEAEQKRLEEQQKANGGTPPDAQGDVQPTGGTAAEGAAAEPPANGGPAKDKEPSGEPPDNL